MAKKFLFACVLVLLTASVISPSSVLSKQLPSGGPADLSTESKDSDTISGQIIVSLNSGQTLPAGMLTSQRNAASFDNTLATLGVTDIEPLLAPSVSSKPDIPELLRNAYILSFPSQYGVDAMLKQIDQLSQVKSAYASHSLKLAEVPATPLAQTKNSAQLPAENGTNGFSLPPNDPYYDQQWGLNAIHMEDAWQRSVGDPNVYVAIIDTGIDEGHVNEFNLKLVDGFDYIDNDSTPNDNDGHGTNVAGIIGAWGDNSYGIAGTAWFPKIVPLKACDQGKCASAQVVRALEYASSLSNVRVINMSFGSYTPDPLLEEAINLAYTRGKTLVAAAGDDATTRPYYPAAYDHVIAVSAMGTNGQLLPSGNVGDYIDLVAPGSEILTTSRTNVLCMLIDVCYEKVSGSFFAAPFVSGVAALMYSILPNTTPDLIERMLEQSASDLGTPGWDREYGWGLLNAGESLRAAQDAPLLSLKLALPGSLGQHQSQPYTIRVRDPKTQELLYENTQLKVNTDGTFTNLPLYGIPTGTYDVILKGPKYLSKRIPNVNLATGSVTSLDFGTMLGGDYNNDDVVNYYDLAMFAHAYHTTNWDFDLSGDGLVDYMDLAVFAVNYHAEGDDYANKPRLTQVVSASTYAQKTIGGVIVKKEAESAPAALLLLPASADFSVGDEFDTTIQLNTANYDLSSADMIIRYDPSALELVSYSWGNLFNSSFSFIPSPESGEIKLGAGSLNQTYNGQGILATLHFRVLAGNISTGVWTYFLPNETVDSNATDFTSGQDALGLVGDAIYQLSGSPDRPAVTASLSLPNGWYLNTMSVPIGIISDTNSSVIFDRITFEAYYDDAWHTIYTDADRTDGWGFDWHTAGILDQIVKLKATIYDINLGETTVTTNDLMLDRTAPSASISAPGLILGGGDFTVKWTGSDELSGISSYDVQYRDGFDGPWVDWKMDTFTNQANFTASPNHTYFFHVRARDYAGNVAVYSPESIVYTNQFIYLPLVIRK